MNEFGDFLSPEYLINLPVRYNERKIIISYKFTVDKQKVFIWAKEDYSSIQFDKVC